MKHVLHSAQTAHLELVGVARLVYPMLSKVQECVSVMLNLMRAARIASCAMLSVMDALVQEIPPARPVLKIRT